MTPINFEPTLKFDNAQLLKDLYLLTNMRVTLYNSKRMRVDSYPGTKCNFCEVVRKNQQVRSKCMCNDSKALDICTNTKSIYVYKCHLGFYEAIIPLFDQSELNGYLMIGQIVNESPEALSFSVNAAKQYIGDEDRLWEVIDQTEKISEEKFMAVCDLLTMISGYISKSELIKSRKNDLAVSVAEYLKKNFTNKITNSDLCCTFFCDRKKMTKAFRDKYGMSIIDYTNNLRMEKAKQLIEDDPDQSVGIIASLVGISDQGYFCKLFFAKYGILPSELKKTLKDNIEEDKKDVEN